jgi:hypothetical protein
MHPFRVHPTDRRARAKENEMNRGTGTGFLGLGLGIVLLIVGALMRYAVTATADGFSINTAGVILLWAGVVAFILGVTLHRDGDPTS